MVFGIFPGNGSVFPDFFTQFLIGDVRRMMIYLTQSERMISILIMASVTVTILLDSILFGYLIVSHL